ncbi:pimeloyl-ACP methyl ester carboxylesterase [Nocardiopsis mwathae]|uniref:Pimeloyl-ACP methyl ester carboxylesterase n=1 Tax=Nocardiopsis mwathae TaxID=1472723 RepID=A0A7X0D513_9ACTN|nr:alpha/beta fold hydrolase [Nocardiopsis mwathae]MBB6171768.1 pimeloyl-ACP methyl ester carboxylesterase [Nocardiopsis mwathae]
MTTQPQGLSLHDISLSATTLGSGPGLLLAHGATGWVDANFGPILGDLARHRTVVAPDYPGSGSTPRAAGPLDLDTLADRLVAAAVEAGLERFALLGYSMGTMVAVRAAARHPERVTALVLTAGLAYPLPHARRIFDGWHTEMAGTELPPERAGALEQIELLQRADTRGDLPGIAAPTLVIATMADDLVSPDHSDVLAEAIPGAQRAELDCGHLVAEDAPKEWARLVTGFLDRVVPVSG